MTRTLSLIALLFGGLVVVAGPRDEEAKKYAEELKSSKSAKTRQSAAKELGRLGQVQRRVTEPHTDVILAALKDSDPKVRGEAAKTLGLIDPTDKKDAIDKLIAILKSEKSEEAREGQEMGLGSLGGTTDDTELKTKARQA